MEIERPSLANLESSKSHVCQVCGTTLVKTRKTYINHDGWIVAVLAGVVFLTLAYFNTALTWVLAAMAAIIGASFVVRDKRIYRCPNCRAETVR